MISALPVVVVTRTRNASILKRAPVPTRVGQGRCYQTRRRQPWWRGDTCGVKEQAWYHTFHSIPRLEKSTEAVALSATAVSLSTSVEIHSGTDQDNPTMDWKGASHSTSGFVTHCLINVQETNSTVVERVHTILEQRRQQQQQQQRQEQQQGEDYGDNLVTELSAEELLQLGAVWFLPAGAPRDPSRGVKPCRLSRGNAHDRLAKGDYLRVHHQPRRFRTVHDYDWTAYTNDTKTESERPGVLVACNATKGWITIDKPANVPVHMTVDNAQENVVACLQKTLLYTGTPNSKNGDEPPYVAATQRLDQNTSGLLIISTSKIFANYFSGLLRSKTKQQLNQGDELSDGIHKLYRCLVAILPPPEDASNIDWTVVRAVDYLRDLASTGQIIRHFLEPSIRAPKRFVAQPPEGEDWPECLLRITKTSNHYQVVGSSVGEQLARNLWDDPIRSRMPPHCQAVVELEIQLLTGRTHQVRGQLAAMGYPLVGDGHYGGAIPILSKDNRSSNDLQLQYVQPHGRLALQCCALEFLDPDIVVNKAGEETMRRSNRWNQFYLPTAWWSHHLEKYDQQSQEDQSSGSRRIESTPNAGDVLLAKRPIRPELLPQRVSLSPGRQKYVLIRAIHPSDGCEHWFVKSALPEECGGSHHGHVAQDLREWIQAAGYTVEVRGGGTIDYRPEEGTAVIYGFSYGFGKADHSKTASIIKQWSGERLNVQYDMTDGFF